jgi:hypothetical protein
MTANAILTIKDCDRSMPVLATSGDGGFHLSGYTFHLGDAFVSKHVELSGIAPTPIRVLVQRHTKEGTAFAIPYVPTRWN